MYAGITLITATSLLFLWVMTCGKRDNSWIDVMWSMCFALPNTTILLVRTRGEGHNARMFLATGLTVAWALRLAGHIWARHRGEDFRYLNFRNEWEKKGDCYFYFTSYWFVYLLQSAFSITCCSSVYFINIWSVKGDNQLFWTDYLGAAIWLFGFLFEAIGDYQLEVFIAKKISGEEKNKFIKTGLWRYTRHPNYFGEVVCWWGIFIIACSMQYGWASVFSALINTWLLRFVSGVPMGTEEKYKDNLEWQQYCRETSIFIPWFATPEDEISNGNKIELDPIDK